MPNTNIPADGHGRHAVVWPPAALAARLSAEEALDALSRRAWGVSVEARRTLASILARVDEHQLPPEAAADELRLLVEQLTLHRHAEEAIRRQVRSSSSPGRLRFG